VNLDALALGVQVVDEQQLRERVLERHEGSPRLEVRAVQADVAGREAGIETSVPVRDGAERRRGEAEQKRVALPVEPPEGTGVEQLLAVTSLEQLSPSDPDGHVRCRVVDEKRLRRLLDAEGRPGVVGHDGHGHTGNRQQYVSLDGSAPQNTSGRCAGTPQPHSAPTSAAWQSPTAPNQYRIRASAGIPV